MLYCTVNLDTMGWALMQPPLVSTDGTDDGRYMFSVQSTSQLAYITDYEFGKYKVTIDLNKTYKNYFI